MKNKKLIVICIIVILVLIIAVGIYFITNNNNNSTTTSSNGIVSSSSNSKISWERNDNIVTDNNYSVEEDVIYTKNVSTKSLTKITLEQFVNKWENTENNFLGYYFLENKIANILDNTIRKGELFSSYETIYVKGVLPRF